MYLLPDQIQFFRFSKMSIESHALRFHIGRASASARGRRCKQVALVPLSVSRLSVSSAKMNAKEQEQKEQELMGRIQRLREAKDELKKANDEKEKKLK